MQHTNNGPNHTIFCAQVGVGARCEKANCVRKTDTGNASGVALHPRHNLGPKVSLHPHHPSLLMNCKPLKSIYKAVSGCADDLNEISQIIDSIY